MTVAQVAPILPYVLLVLVLIVRPDRALRDARDMSAPAPAAARGLAGRRHAAEPAAPVRGLGRRRRGRWSCCRYVLRAPAAVPVMNQMGIAVIFALSYNMLLGQGGMLSFGHAVYFGLGGFIAAHALNLAARQASVAAGAAGAPRGRAGRAALRGARSAASRRNRAGTVFAMISLGIAEMMAASSLIFDRFFGGEEGITTNRAKAASLGGSELHDGPGRLLPHRLLGPGERGGHVRVLAHAGGPDGQRRARQPRARRVRRLQPALRSATSRSAPRASSPASRAGCSR